MTVHTIIMMIESAIKDDETQYGTKEFRKRIEGIDFCFVQRNYKHSIINSLRL